MNSIEQKLETINELIAALSEGERANYHEIMYSMEMHANVFEPYCSWSKDCYTRNCIAQNDKFELILLCWEKEQCTPIHDHGGEECWVKIIEGEFRETIYNVDEAGEVKPTRSTTSKVNDITYMIDFMGYHSLKNLSNKRSMSLHLYAKPIRNCNVFDEDSSKFVNKDLVYDTVS